MKLKFIITKFIFIALPIMLLIWFLILMVYEEDYLGAIQTCFSLVDFAITIISAICSAKRQFKRPAMLIYCFSVFVFIIANIIWTIGLIQEKSDVISIIGTSSKENGNAMNGDVIAETVEISRNVINFNFSTDHYIKSLDEYTVEKGSEKEKIHALFMKQITDWMTEWDSKVLGEAGSEYDAKRGKIDELYNICCKPEAKSEYLKEKAIEDYEEIIVELDEAYKIWSNPELKKEKALRYLDMGDLYQTLGENSKARDCFENAMDVSWEGIGLSIQYGMGTNVEELLEVLGDCFEKIENLPDANLATWDYSRAALLKQEFDDMSQSFRSNFIKKDSSK